MNKRSKIGIIAYTDIHAFCIANIGLYIVSAKKNYSTRIRNSLLFGTLIAATRIMSWPRASCVPFKIVKMRRTIEGWAGRIPCYFIRSISVAFRSNIFYILAFHVATFLFDQTSTTFLANQPMVYI